MSQHNTGMPVDLVLVRHGQSEGNIAVKAALNGDESFYTDAFVNTPGHQWRLSQKGRDQAACTGAWLREQFIDNPRLGPFDRHYVSPFVRTRETAALLDVHWTTPARRIAFAGLSLPFSCTKQTHQPRWYLNRSLRERNWGWIDTLPKSRFNTSPEFALSRKQQDNDPLYWTPPGGESIADVAENRVRNFLDTLHREMTGRRVIAVTHGEWMSAFRTIIERLDDDQFADIDADSGESIHNCEVFHYTRRNPHVRHGSDISGRVEWVRRARPIEQPDGTFTMEVGEWRHIDFDFPDNDALLASLPTLDEANAPEEALGVLSAP